MGKKCYVLMLEGEPRYVTTNLEDIKKECQSWFDQRYDNFVIQHEYSRWLEGRDWYPNTDEGEEEAWNDYVEEHFNDGTWGDYEWWECYLKDA